MLRDLEFVQFHPTVMYLGPESRGQQPLISEAVRGEGAFLVDFEGDRFMQGVHELADLAPRDVVAKAIMRRMIETGHAAHVARRPAPRRGVLGAALPDHPRHRPLARRRPGHRADPGRAGLPLRLRRRRAPTCGAAPTCPGLYATGEVACSGVHGANRLASNSLLEGLVFSRRIAEVLPGELRPWADPAADARTAGLVPGRGAPRAAGGDDRARSACCAAPTGSPRPPRRSTSWRARAAEPVDQDSWETTNLLTISAALADAAALREETRGSHWREDFPERDDARWAGHFDAVIDDGATTCASGRRRPATDPAVSPA